MNGARVRPRAMSSPVGREDLRRMDQRGFRNPGIFVHRKTNQRDPGRDPFSQTNSDPFLIPVLILSGGLSQRSFEKLFQDGLKHNGLPIFQTAKSTCVSLSARWVMTSFGGRFRYFINGLQNRSRPVLETDKIYRISSSLRQGMTRFGGHFRTFRKTASETGRDPFWKRASGIAFHCPPNGS